MSLSIVAKVEVNLFWYSIDRLTSSSLVSLRSASSERHIFDNKSVTLLTTVSYFTTLVKNHPLTTALNVLARVAPYLNVQKR